MKATAMTMTANAAMIPHAPVPLKMSELELTSFNDKFIRRGSVGVE